MSFCPTCGKWAPEPVPDGLEDTIKPCRTCASRQRSGDAELVESAGKYHVRCYGCHLSTGDYNDPREAVEEWNALWEGVEAEDKLKVIWALANEQSRIEGDYSGKVQALEMIDCMSQPEASGPLAGNAVAMRVWLERLDALMQLPPRTDDKAEARNMIRAALSAPPRNCDVGTPDEQASRFFEFCHAHKTPANTCSPKCPFYKKEAICNCITGWGQLPYEAPAKEGGEA